MSSVWNRYLVMMILMSPLQVYAYAYVGQLGGSQAPPTPNQFFGDPVIWSNTNVALTLNFDPEYNSSAQVAMEQWNAEGTPLHFRVGFTAAQPCNNDGINATGWRISTCGENNFGDALAITTRNYRFNNQTGLWEIQDADIILDQSRPWVASFAGSLSSIQDFRRVMVHELGHVLGLEHPDEAGQDVDAIMNSSVSDIETLQDDDRQGIIFLYGVGSGPATSGNIAVSESTGGRDGGGEAGGVIVLLLPLWLWRHMRPTRSLNR